MDFLATATSALGEISAELQSLETRLDALHDAHVMAVPDWCHCCCGAPIGQCIAEPDEFWRVEERMRKRAEYFWRGGL